MRLVLGEREHRPMRMPDDRVRDGAEPVGGEAAGAVRRHHDEVGEEAVGDLLDQPRRAPVLAERCHAHPVRGGGARGDAVHIGARVAPNRVVRGEHVLREDRPLRRRPHHRDRDVRADQVHRAAGPLREGAGDGDRALGEGGAVERNEEGAQHARTPG